MLDNGGVRDCLEEHDFSEAALEPLPFGAGRLACSSRCLFNAWSAVSFPSLRSVVVRFLAGERGVKERGVAGVKALGVTGVALPSQVGSSHDSLLEPPASLAML